MKSTSSNQGRVFISDCEGPISKNDNAFELTSHFVPEGDYSFSLISKYDDVLADLVKREGYKAGNTLKLILPFLKAYGATDDGMRAFSSQSILLVPGADDMLRFVNGIMPSFIISTSYEHYILSVCDVIGFPKENVYCTRLNLNKYVLSDEEVEELKALRGEISRMPMIEIPENADSVDDLSKRDQSTVEILDEIFWEVIPRMAAGRMLEEVNPMGGYEKANAIRDIVKRTDAELSDIIYVGDSITDVEPFQLVREGGGLTVSFNGNQYAIREAEIAVLSDHAIITSILAEVFSRFGRDVPIDLAGDWNRSSLKDYCRPELFEGLTKLCSEISLKVETITPANRKRLMRESVDFRKTVRGEAIGELG
jgi:energy-converting hydrogenase A subunit R